MKELKSPKLVNSLAQKKQQNKLEHQDAGALLQLFQNIQPVEIVKMIDSRKKSQSVLYLYEDEAENKFKELILLGVSNFQQQQHSQALFQFKQAEQILTAMTNPQLQFQLINKINIDYQGVSFYAIGWLENAFTCFEDTIILLKKFLNKSNDRILLDTIRIQCLLQCCIILSEIGQHIDALALSKIAIKKSLKLLFDLHEQSEDSCKKKLIEEILKKSLALQQLKPKQQGKIITFPSNKQVQLTSDNLTQFFKDCTPQYIDKANILSYLQMNPQNFETLMFEDFSNSQKFLHMLSFFAISLYCASTESRFIEQILDPHQFSEAENYLSRALEIVYLYFPKEMPIVSQLLNVHNRFHDISKQIIQEDVDYEKEQSFEVVLLKPIIEPQKCGFLIPVIRKSKCAYMLNERTVSLKEQLFQHCKMQNDQKQVEFTRPSNRKLRSISTTNKKSSQSPKYNFNQLAEIQQKRFQCYNSNQEAILKNNFRQTHFKKPSTRETVNWCNFEKPKLNINFLVINNVNHVQFNGRRKRGTSFNLESIQLPQSATPNSANSTKGNRELLKSYQMQSRIKKLIKSYHIQA